jgi:predicted MFS family arabinose efflux permease
MMGANHLTVEGMGLVPTLTQAGYALGILFLLPLGDRHDRRRLILVKSARAGAPAAPVQPHRPAQLTAGGQSADRYGGDHGAGYRPGGGDLAPAGKQGKMVGTVMTGLLLGILLSRTVSGVVGAVFGWRVMYQAAAVSVALIGLVMWRVLPRFAIHSTLSYPQLMASMAHLWQRYPALRALRWLRGALIAFSAFWSTLAVMLSEHYHMGSAVAGGFGIAGAAGALAAPLAGGLADKFGAGKVTQMGAALVTVSFALMFMLPLLPLHGQLALIALSAIGFDLGLQSSLVAHQNLMASSRRPAAALTPCCSPWSLSGCRWGRCWAASCTCWPAGTGWLPWPWSPARSPWRSACWRMPRRCRTPRIIKNPLRLRRSGFIPTTA